MKKYFDTGTEVLEWVILCALTMLTAPLWLPVMAIGVIANRVFGWEPIERPEDMRW